MRLSTSTRPTKCRHFHELPNETPGSLVESGMGNLFSVPGQKLCSRRNRMSHETRHTTVLKPGLAHFQFTKKKFWKYRSKMSVQSKRVPFALLHYLPLSVVRANSSDLTPSMCLKFNIETMVELWCVLSFIIVLCISKCAPLSDGKF